MNSEKDQQANSQPTQKTTIFKKGTFWERFLASIIDTIIQFVIGIILGIIIVFSKSNFLYIISFFVSLLYGILFLGLIGATPGMKLLKLKLLSTTYEKINFGTAIIRALASILSSLGLNLGYAWVLIDRKRQTWHDKLAKTYVVKLDTNGNLIPITEDEEITTGQKVTFIVICILPIVIGVLAILLAITLIAINPAKQFSQANNTKRESDANAIANAYIQYEQSSMSGPQPLLPSAPPQPTEISSNGFSICSNLVPSYLAALPSDPLNNNGTPVSDCTGSYDTGYTISVDSQGNVTVSAPEAELGRAISVTRTLPHAPAQ